MTLDFENYLGDGGSSIGQAEVDKALEEVNKKLDERYTKQETEELLDKKANNEDLTNVDTRVQALETELEAFLESPEVVPGTIYEEI